MTTPLPTALADARSNTNRPTITPFPDGSRWLADCPSGSDMHVGRVTPRRDGRSATFRCFMDSCTASGIYPIDGPLLHLATDGPIPDLHAASSARGPADVLAEARVELVALIRDGIPERERLAGTPFIAGKRHLFPAKAGAGKSLAGTVVAVDVVAAGGTVVIIDMENGPDEYARRLEMILADRPPEVAEACAERLRYFSYPALSLTWTPADWTEALADADLVIFDSSRMLLSSVGLGEDKADEYAQFCNAFLMPLARAGITTFTLDNTGHEEQDRARGSAAKADLNELVYTVKVTREFSIETTGELELKRTRTRFAEAPERLTMTLGGGTYSGPVAAEAKPSDEGFRPTHLMERGARAVERAPGMQTTELLAIIGGKRQWSLQAVALLVSEDYLLREQDGRSQRHFPNPDKLYREAADPLSDKYVVPDVPRGSQGFPEPGWERGSHGSPPEGGPGTTTSTKSANVVPSSEAES